MKAYILRRILLLIPTWILLTILVFLSVRFIPGDVIDAMVGRMQYMAGDIDREALEKMLGLDLPVHVQYGKWMGGILFQGTMGESLLGGWTVEEKVFGRLPLTIELGLLAIAIAILIAVPVGIYSAILQDTAGDYVGRSVAIIGLATPDFWLATMVMIYPAIWWGLVSSHGIGSIHGRSAETSFHLHHSLFDSGNSLFGKHHAFDAHDDARSSASGLYSYGLGQGSQGTHSDCQTCC